MVFAANHLFVVHADSQSGLWARVTQEIHGISTV